MSHYEIPIRKSNNNTTGWAWACFFALRLFIFSRWEAECQHRWVTCHKGPPKTNGVTVLSQKRYKKKLPPWKGATHRLGCFYGHKSVIPFLPANVSEGPVICDVLCDVGNFVNSMMMLKGLERQKEEPISGDFPSELLINKRCVSATCEQAQRALEKLLGPDGRKKELRLPLRNGGFLPWPWCCDQRDKQDCSDAQGASVMGAPSSACRGQSASLGGTGSFHVFPHDTAQSTFCTDI